MRLDKWLVENKIARGREQAKDMIERELILVNGKVMGKKTYLVLETDRVESLNPEDLSYVGRGAEKIRSVWHEDYVSLIENQYVADFGASTGGFTQFLLQKNAKQVLAIDVGTNQLHPELKNDPRVVSWEGFHLKDLSLNEADYPFLVKFFVADLSFISLRKVFSFFLRPLDINGPCYFLILFKPQFEIGETHDPKKFLKKGVLQDQRMGMNLVVSFQQWLIQEFEISPEKFRVERAGQTYQAKVEWINVPQLCKVVGKSGNQEYFLHGRLRFSLL